MLKRKNEGMVNFTQIRFADKCKDARFDRTIECALTIRLVPGND